jgi:hypothetical protein
MFLAGNMKALHECHRRFQFWAAAEPVQFTRYLIAAAAITVRLARVGNEEEYHQIRR